MKATAKQTGIQGRIINVASNTHHQSDGSFFDLDTINDQSKYNRRVAYGRSKLSNILHANALSKHLKEEGINLTANSLHPGIVPTNIVRYINLNATLLKILAFVAQPILKSVPEGASTSCYLALHPRVKDVTGKYFINCKEAIPSKQARDEDIATKLWEFSEDLSQKKQ